jgi:hypothetical protein
MRGSPTWQAESCLLRPLRLFVSFPFCADRCPLLCALAARGGGPHRNMWNEDQLDKLATNQYVVGKYLREIDRRFSR